MSVAQSCRGNGVGLGCRGWWDNGSGAVRCGVEDEGSDELWQLPLCDMRRLDVPLYIGSGAGLQAVEPMSQPMFVFIEDQQVDFPVLVGQYGERCGGDAVPAAAIGGGA